MKLIKISKSIIIEKETIRYGGALDKCNIRFCKNCVLVYLCIFKQYPAKIID